jgi:glycosyltransferase involved in cell wall biosynthesis
MNDSRVRIVDVINLSSSADTLLRERVKSLRAKGVDNRIVCIDGPYVKPLRAAGIPVDTFHLPRGLDPIRLVWSLIELTRYFRRVKPDLVHTHCSVPGIVGRLAARLAGVPVVVHTVHGFAFHDGSRGLGTALAIAIERLAAGWTDVMLSQNREDMERAQQLGITPRRRLEYVGNGIALERFLAETPHRAVGRPAVITCVARFEPVKNHELLFQAAELLKERGARFELRLVGGGEGRARAERRVAELGLAGHVRFLGYRDDIPALLAWSDIGVLTSLKEGIPRAAVEAMAAGLPMVATRVTGTREVVRDGDSGLLVDAGDAVALAEALAKLIDDPALRASMGARGREIVMAEFDETLIVRRLERIYRDSLEHQGIGVPSTLASEVQA